MQTILHSHAKENGLCWSDKPYIWQFSLMQKLSSSGDFYCVPWNPWPDKLSSLNK